MLEPWYRHSMAGLRQSYGIVIAEAIRQYILCFCFTKGWAKFTAKAKEASIP